MNRNPEDIDMRLLAKWKATGKVDEQELADVVMAVLNHADLAGDAEATVHPELLELLGELACGKVAMQTARDKERRRKRDERHASWQAQADEIWARHPSWFKTPVANQIWDEMGRPKKPSSDHPKDHREEKWH